MRSALIKVILFFVGIMIMFFSFGDAKAIWTNDIGKIYDKGMHDYDEGELVTGKMEYVFDVVAQLESSQTMYGIPVSKKITPYYLCGIPYNEATDKGGYFIIVHVTDKKSIEAMDELMRKSNYGENPANGKPVALEYRTKFIPDEVMDYTMEYLVDDEFTEQDAKSMLAVYMLEETDYDSDKFMPLIGLIITLIPVIMIIVSRRKIAGYKSTRTHYVNEEPTDPYNTAPVTSDGTPAAPMKRYSSGAYEAHTAAGGLPQQTTQNSYDPSAYGGSDNYQPGEMDSIDTTNLKL